MTNEVIIYTDGASSGNPGPGGYGTILLYGPHRKEISEGFRKTTNNRMELLSVIKGLEALNKPCKVKVYSDSKYVVDAVEKGWLFNWEKKNFKDKKNIDLWTRFLKIYRKHQVTFYWVKGHSGNVLNEACDQLAVKASSSGNLKIDHPYENEK